MDRYAYVYDSDADNYRVIVDRYDGYDYNAWRFMSGVPPFDDKSEVERYVRLLNTDESNRHNDNW